MNYMSYEEFNEKILEDAKNIAAQVMGPEVKVTIKDDVSVFSGKVLCMKYPCDDHAYVCCLELKPAYESYIRRPVWAEFIRALRKKLEEMKTLSGGCGVGFLRSFETAKEHLLLSPVPFTHREKVDTEVCVMMDDIPMAVYFVISDDKTKQTIARLPGKILKEWKVSEEEVLAAAMENQMKADKPVFATMSELSPLMKLLVSEQEDEFIWVGTTESRRFGAVVISYPGYLDSVCEKIGADVFITPASINSVIFIKEDHVEKELLSMRDDFVNYINRHDLDDEDILSDKVYHYERATQTFESAKAWYQRVHGLDM